jgi:hypothetical protein
MFDVKAYQKAYHAKWWVNNRKKLTAQRKAQNTNEQRSALRKTRRDEAIAKRGGCCIKCGSTVNLEFHHRNRDEKEVSISHIWLGSEKNREKELAKCDLLCTKCHDLETAKERGWGTSPHGTKTSYDHYGCRCKACSSARAEYSRRLRNKLKKENQ